MARNVQHLSIRGIPRAMSLFYYRGNIRADTTHFSRRNAAAASVRRRNCDEHIIINSLV